MIKTTIILNKKINGPKYTTLFSLTWNLATHNAKRKVRNCYWIHYRTLNKDAKKEITLVLRFCSLSIQDFKLEFLCFFSPLIWALQSPIVCSSSQRFPPLSIASFRVSIGASFHSPNFRYFVGLKKPKIPCPSYSQATP